VVRRHLKWWALLLIAAFASFAQQPALDDGKQAAPKDCGSVVIVKCDRSASERSVSTPEQPRQPVRRVDLRRQNPFVQPLEGVVIEGELIRRRSIEETMASAFPTVRPRDGNYTFDTGAGSKCTCMNVCPPWPLPCCTCSAPMGRYIGMPGSSPLN
jgi:hypothetical protein